MMNARLGRGNRMGADSRALTEKTWGVSEEPESSLTASCLRVCLLMALKGCSVFLASRSAVLLLFSWWRDGKCRSGGVRRRRRPQTVNSCTTVGALSFINKVEASWEGVEAWCSGSRRGLGFSGRVPYMIVRVLFMGTYWATCVRLMTRRSTVLELRLLHFSLQKYRILSEDEWVMSLM